MKSFLLTDPLQVGGINSLVINQKTLTEGDEVGVRTLEALRTISIYLYYAAVRFNERGGSSWELHSVICDSSMLITFLDF